MMRVSGEEGASVTRSARPGRRARAVATAAIPARGNLRRLIGYALVDVSCSGDCDWQLGVGAFLGSVVCASGVAVVAALTLRAMSEWRGAPQGSP